MEHFQKAIKFQEIEIYRSQGEDERAFNRIIALSEQLRNQLESDFFLLPISAVVSRQIFFFYFPKL